MKPKTKTIVDAMKWASSSTSQKITPDGWVESYEWYLEYGESLTEFMAAQRRTERAT